MSQKASLIGVATRVANRSSLATLAVMPLATCFHIATQLFYSSGRNCDNEDGLEFVIELAEDKEDTTDNE